MCRQVGRDTRYPMPLQVVGSGAEDAPMGAQPPGHQAAVGQFADPDREVEAFRDDVDEALRIVGFQHHLRMRQGELRQQRTEPEPAHRRRQGDAQASAQLRGAQAGFVLGLVEQVDGLAEAARQALAFIGEAQLPGGAFDQADAEATLQCAEPLREHRGMALQGAAGGGERTVLGQGQERGDFIGLPAVERLHACASCGWVRARVPARLASVPPADRYAPRPPRPAGSAARPGAG
ncbi:Arsenate reductase and related proteins, glutaredoxin family [Acinetobacter baumannii]|nr:Arsenate reductase and related proteins, glutaredoxin family [Acinetobacter baumannii]